MFLFLSAFFNWLQTCIAKIDIGDYWHW